ncbi:MAG TPA: acetyl-CoA acetyltransferase [Acidimicrobiales bacterium]|nr:acetyl-CoA acetyltransferase [Acidimicrobiales bacterium]
MSGPDPRAPCLIGVAQRTWRPAGPEEQAPEPLAMWEEVSRAAADDAGRPDLIEHLQSVDVVYCQSWPYDDPPGRLAARLGCSPARARYSGVGGTTPQVLVDETALAMLRGELDLALVVGAECLDTVRRLKKAGERPRWSFRDPERKPFPFEAPFHPAEVAHEVFQAWLTFPLWDVARRAHLGVDPVAHRNDLGRLMAPMTEVAARNPHAWFPVVRRAEELITPTPANRMVAYPYTKYMVSVMDVDMAAALLLATHGRADELGVPPERRVYLRGWCFATDPVYVAEHEPMWASPAMRAASEAALRSAALGIDEVAHLELYSCFASSLNLALDALDVGPGDGRGTTVTGGLPFSGGPGSNYMTHAIAEMAGVLRRDPVSAGLVSGVGMHNTKHVFAAYSAVPGPVRPPDQGAVQAGLDARPVKEIRDVAPGPAVVAAYTVAHRRDGSPDWGLAVCDVPDGRRCYARVVDPGLLALAEETELVGASVRLVAGDGNVNLLSC